MIRNGGCCDEHGSCPDALIHSQESETQDVLCRPGVRRRTSCSPHVTALPRDSLDDFVYSSAYNRL